MRPFFSRKGLARNGNHEEVRPERLVRLQCFTGCRPAYTCCPPSEPAPEIKPALEPFIEAIIANGLVFKGVVSGASSLLIDGEVVGNIDLPNSRVTVGLTGCVSDGLSICIRAREIVVMGKVRGNISATDLVDIQSEGSLTGNVNAARISIADGAFFKGDINLHTPQPKPAVSVMRETKEMKVYA